MGQFVRVADVKDIPMNESLIVEEQGYSVAIFNISGNFHAIDNICPHMGGPLGEGLLNNYQVTCPLHGWTFDTRNGACTHDNTISVPVYPVKVEGNDVLIQLPG